jgi:hypothetical protein
MPRRRPAPKPLGSSRRYLGSWVLPSGNSCNVYLASAAGGRFDSYFEWDEPPSPAWPEVDVLHYQVVTWPAVLRAVATELGLRRVVGVQL